MNLSTLIALSATTTERQPIACALSIFRAAHGLSQAALADAAGVSASVVSTAERTGKISEESVISLAAGMAPEFGALLVQHYVWGLDLGDVPSFLTHDVLDLIGQRYDKRVGELRAKAMAAKSSMDSEPKTDAEDTLTITQESTEPTPLLPLDIMAHPDGGAEPMGIAQNVAG